MPSKTQADYIRERDNAQREKTGAAADAAASSTIGASLAGKGAQKDPLAPELNDFPNPGGLGGVAAQNKAFSEALARYNSDPQFKATFAAQKRKVLESAMGDAAMLQDKSAVKGNRSMKSMMPAEPDEDDKLKRPGVGGLVTPGL